MWASTRSKGRVPALKSYLIQADATPETAEGKARRNLAAVKLLSAQFGIPMRREAKATKDP